VELTRLERSFEGNTPMVCPWRIIAIGPNRSAIIADLSR